MSSSAAGVLPAGWALDVQPRPEGEETPGVLGESTRPLAVSQPLSGCGQAGPAKGLLLFRLKL